MSHLGPVTTCPWCRKSMPLYHAEKHLEESESCRIWRDIELWLLATRFKFV